MGRATGVGVSRHCSGGNAAQGVFRSAGGACSTSGFSCCCAQLQSKGKRAKCTPPVVLKQPPIASLTTCVHTHCAALPSPRSMCSRSSLRNNASRSTWAFDSSRSVERLDWALSSKFMTPFTSSTTLSSHSSRFRRSSFSTSARYLGRARRELGWDRRAMGCEGTQRDAARCACTGG